MSEDMPSDAKEAGNPYAGRWIAKIKGKVVGQGGTAIQAKQAAKAAQFKEKPEIVYMPMSEKLMFSPVVDQIREVVKDKSKVYLVGGAVRDALLQKSSKDLDFALAGDALKLARKVANKLGGAYYRLDDEHQAGRVILNQGDGESYVLDFAKFRGKDIEADLRGRDFTINALAVNLGNTEELIDPTGGVADLHTHTLRACSSKSFEDDPLRILRAIRFASALKMKIETDTRSLMKVSIKEFGRVSPERVRDELFKILATRGAATSIRALDMMGALPQVLPELVEMKGVEQSPPHIYEVWEHTLQTLQYLEKLYTVLSEEHDEEKVSDLHFGSVVIKLGRYREQIREHLSQKLNRDRSLLPLVFMAALFHDVGKPHTKSIDEDRRIRFFDHENIGAEITENRAEALGLSSKEVDYLTTIVRNHMRPHHLVYAEKAPTRRAVYRFFRNCGPAGVDACLLSLADVMATYSATLTQERLEKQLDVIRTLLEAYWEHFDKRVSPPKLIGGEELIKEFGLEPGPKIGEVLEAIREGQVEGEVETRGDALKLAEEWLKLDEEDIA